MTSTTTRLVGTVIAIIAAATMALGLSGCSTKTPSEVASQDLLVKKEFEARGYTNPVKLKEGSAWSSGDTWAATLGLCRVQYLLLPGDVLDWQGVGDATTKLGTAKYAHCRVTS